MHLRRLTVPAALALLLAAFGASAGPPPPPALHTPRASQALVARAASPARPRLTNNAATEHAHWVPTKVPVFGPSGLPKASDVKQTIIGDCYFESSIASVAATSPAWLKKLIRENDDGTVTVRLYVHDKKDPATGRWKFTPIDQTFDRKVPVSPEDGKPIYNHGAASWPSFLQLAYAKMMGSYARLNQGGLGNVGLELVTGREADYALVDVVKDSNLGGRIRSALQSGKPVVLGTRSKEEFVDAVKKLEKTNPALYEKASKLAADPDKAYAKMGLIDNHEYHVIGADERDGKQLTVIRNPWGSFKPKPGQVGRPEEPSAGHGVFHVDDEWLPLVYGDVAIGEVPK